ncbi:Hypothetical_protein [Hexamita inflata]|uniref:Hypothetical_protein n=1 Tax=Hexamita inflata TaxID=28002 RepID=A0AA86Q8E2_9EUKA|nr:Hypothetical protein HINF_LOCUS38618 [Hexamita inflata]
MYNVILIERYYFDCFQFNHIKTLSAITQQALRSQPISQINQLVSNAKQQLIFENQAQLDFIVDNHEVVYNTIHGSAEYIKKLHLQQQLLGQIDNSINDFLTQFDEQESEIYVEQISQSQIVLLLELLQSQDIITELLSTDQVAAARFINHCNIDCPEYLLKFNFSDFEAVKILLNNPTAVNIQKYLETQYTPSQVVEQADPIQIVIECAEPSILTICKQFDLKQINFFTSNDYLQYKQQLIFILNQLEIISYPHQQINILLEQMNKFDLGEQQFDLSKELGVEDNPSVIEFLQFGALKRLFNKYFQRNRIQFPHNSESKKQCLLQYIMNASYQSLNQIPVVQCAKMFVKEIDLSINTLYIEKLAELFENDKEWVRAAFKVQGFDLDVEAGICDLVKIWE